MPVDAVTASGLGPRPAHLASPTPGSRRRGSPTARGLGARRGARARRRRTPTGARSASSASPASTCSSSTSRSTRAGIVACHAMARGHAPHLPRRRARASARPSPCSTRAAGAASAAPTSSSASSRPTAAPKHRRADRRPRGRPARTRSSTAARPSRRWTSTPILARAARGRARRRAGPHQRPGLAHEKRWQDVEELLDAGIDVISTRQHPAPRVAQRRRRADHRASSSARPFPTRSCARADQIELVDMTPEALRRRMAHGNIYPAENGSTPRSATTSAPATSAALRELALLWVADRVDEALRDYRERHGIDQPWETRERVVVAVTGAPGGEHARSGGRRGWRRGRRASSSACTSARQDGLAGPVRGAARASSARCSSELGGDLPRGRRAPTSATALVEVARAENATQIVLGATRRSRWAELTRGSVINRVIRDAGPGIDVHVITPTADDGRRTACRARRTPGRALAPAPAGRVRARAARRRRCSTCVLANLREHLGLPSVLLLFLLLVVGRRGGRRRLARARRRGRRLPARRTGTSRRRSTPSRSARARTCSRSSSSSSVARHRQRASSSSPRAAPAEGSARPRGGGDARARSPARASPVPTRCSTACGRVFGLDARRRCCTRTGDGWTDRGVVGSAGAAVRRTTPTTDGLGRRSPRARARRRPGVAADDQRVLDAFAAAARRRARARGARRPRRPRRARSRPRTSCAPRSCSRGLARPAHAARRDQGVGHEPAPARRRLDARGDGTSSWRRSTRRPTGSTTSSATCST